MDRLLPIPAETSMLLNTLIGDIYILGGRHVSCHFGVGPNRFLKPEIATKILRTFLNLIIIMFDITNNQ